MPAGLRAVADLHAVGRFELVSALIMDWIVIPASAFMVTVDSTVRYNTGAHSMYVGWCGGTVGWASDLRFIGRGFESCLGTIAWWPRAALLTPVCLCHQAV